MFLRGNFYESHLLNALHLRVDHPRVLPLLVDVVDLGEEVLLPEERVQDVVHVHGQDGEEPGRPRRVHGVAGVVGVSPGVGPVRQAPVGQEVQDL